MKYRDLLERLSKASESELDQDVSIYDQSRDEFYSLVTDGDIRVCSDGDCADGILDEGHLYIVFSTMCSYPLPDISIKESILRLLGSEELSVSDRNNIVVLITALSKRIANKEK